MTHPKNPSLLPCPFCGAPAELERGSDHHGEWFNLGCSQHWGNVNPDNACIGGRMFYTETEKTEAEASAAWNTRPEAADRITELEAQVERLREALEEAGTALAWAGRQMKGNCRGNDIDAVNLAAGNAVHAALTTKEDGHAG